MLFNFFDINKYLVLLLIYLLTKNIYAQQNCNLDSEKTTPNERFIVNNIDNFYVVIDLKTNLMWKHCLEGLYGDNCSIGNTRQYKWRTSFDIATQSSYANYTNWRIPNIDELKSIIEYSCINPSINKNIFPNSNNSFVWSSNQYITRKYYFAKGVDFTDGKEHLDFQIAENSIRLVRNMK